MTFLCGVMYIKYIVNCLICLSLPQHSPYKMKVIYSGWSFLHGCIGDGCRRGFCMYPEVYTVYSRVCVPKVGLATLRALGHTFHRPLPIPFLSPPLLFSPSST